MRKDTVPSVNLRTAKMIRCRRQEQLINSEFKFLDRETPKLDFLAYFERKCKGRNHKWKCSYLHFCQFTKGKRYIIGLSLLPSSTNCHCPLMSLVSG